MIEITHPQAGGRPHFELTPAAHRILSSLQDKLVAVVAVTGPSRSGKSFLLNALLGGGEGFPLGHSTNPGTKGIWLWAEPAVQGDTAVLFIDTEGLYSVSRDRQVDSCVLGISLLLSSVFVYNNFQVVDEKQLGEVAAVLELARWTQKDATAPHLLWCVRDFALSLDGFKDPDDYLESVLAARAQGEEARLRRTVREFFPSRGCLLFVMPVEGPRLQQLDRLRFAELRPEFRRAIEAFRTAVNARLAPKRFAGAVLNGLGFLGLVEEVLRAFNSNDVPELKGAVQLLTERARENVLQRFEEAVQRVAYEGEGGEDWQLVAPLGRVLRLAAEHCEARQERELTLDVCQQLCGRLLSLRAESLTWPSLLSSETQTALEEAIEETPEMILERVRTVFAQRQLARRQLPLAMVERLLIRLIRTGSLQMLEMQQERKEKYEEAEKDLTRLREKGAHKADEISAQQIELVTLRQQLSEVELAFSDTISVKSAEEDQNNRGHFARLQSQVHALEAEIAELSSFHTASKASKVFVLQHSESLIDDLPAEQAREFKAYLNRFKERLVTENVSLRTMVNRIAAENTRLGEFAIEQREREDEVEALKKELRNAAARPNTEQIEKRAAMLIAENKCLHGDKVHFSYLLKELVLASRKKKNQLRHALTFFAEEDAEQLRGAFTKAKLAL